jgi:hypothetical protein
LSHLVTIQTEIRDPAAVRAACQRLNLPPPVLGTTKLYRGEVTGLAVQLPAWIYPVVCDTAQGKIRFDNFAGRWGEQKHLDTFLQRYAVEKAKIESRKRGHTCVEQSLADGSIKLTIQMAGGTA